MSSIWTVRRSATDTKVAGLCGGVAEHWGIDPVLVRVGWALLALSGGVGVVLYLAGWLLIPLVGQDRAPVDDLLGESVRRWPKSVLVLLVVAACLVVLTTFGAFLPFGVGPAVIVAGIWYFGFYRSRPARPPAPPAGLSAPGPGAAPAAVTPFTEAADAWRRRVEEHTRQYGAPVPTASDDAPTTSNPATSIPAAGAPTTWPVMSAAAAQVQDPDPEVSARTAFLAEPDPVGLYAAPAPAPGTVVGRPPRGADRLSARRLRLSGLVVLGLALAGLGFADRAGVPVSPTVYAATALLVVGLTLVMATWLGRARGLLPLGLLLVPVVLTATALGPITHLDRWTTQRPQYGTVAELPAAGDRLEAGQLVVDLTRLPTAEDASYTAHVGTGRLAVVAPAGSNVVVDYQVGLGAVQVDGQQVEGGSRLSGSRTSGPVRPGAPTLTLHLSVDRGELAVSR